MNGIEDEKESHQRPNRRQTQEGFPVVRRLNSKTGEEKGCRFFPDPTRNNGTLKKEEKRTDSPYMEVKVRNLKRLLERRY